MKGWVGLTVKVKLWRYDRIYPQWWCTLWTVTSHNQYWTATAVLLLEYSSQSSKMLTCTPSFDSLDVHICKEDKGIPFDVCNIIISMNWKQCRKKRSERRRHCALAVGRWSQKFSPRRRPPSRGHRKAKI